MPTERMGPPPGASPPMRMTASWSGSKRIDRIQVCGARSAPQWQAPLGSSHYPARTETQRHIDVLHRYVQLARPTSQNTANMSSAGETRVERQRTIDQRHHGADVLAEI